MTKTEKYLEGLTIHKVPYNIANTSDFKTNVMANADDNELFIITDTPTFSLKIGNVTYDGTSNVSATTATQSASGLMSAADKKKLDGIATGANKTIVDTSVSSTSTNPVQNKVIKTELDKKADKTALDAKADKTALDGKLDKTGGTLTGNLTGKYITGTWLQTTQSTDLGRAPGKVAVLDDSGWVYYRTPAEIKSDIGADAVVTTSANGLMSASDKSKLDGIAAGAEVNQKAFSNVTVGSTTIAADSKTDTLTIAAGNNITLTPDATNDKITIAAKDTVYTHPSYTARTGVPTKNATPAFGGTFKVSQPVSDATGHITAINSRTITIPSSTATTSKAGLMSASDKTKLNAMDDYIVELGSDNNNWTYRKWNSGWLECWRTLSISGYACNTPINTGVGSWYRTAILTPAPYPVTFDYAPYLQMFFETDTGTGGFVWPAGTDSDDNPTVRPHKFYIVRMTSSNSISGKIHFYASGWILGSGM